jgi:hypothetical protein
MTLASLIMQAYPSPEWAVFFEVANGTGSRATRWADAVAMGVWPSRGHALIGFECKEDRRDWLREKKNPEKAEAVASHCDSWYVVAGVEGIVQLEELPEPWGLLVANKDRTKLLNKKVCQPFPDRDKTVLRRPFVASMLRKVPETTVPKADVARQVELAVAAEVERTNTGFELQQLRKRVETDEKAFEAFQAATGVDLRHGWRGPVKIAQAVAAVLSMGSDRVELERTVARLELSARSVREVLAAWPAAAATEVDA